MIKSLGDDTRQSLDAIHPFGMIPYCLSADSIHREKRRFHAAINCGLWLDDDIKNVPKTLIAFGVRGRAKRGFAVKSALWQMKSTLWMKSVLRRMKSLLRKGY